MRKSIILLACVFIFTNSFCQTPKINWGNEFKLRRGSTDLSVIYSDKSGVYLQEDHQALKTYFVIGATTRNSATLVKLDKNLSEVYRNDFSRELKGKQFDQFFILQNKMLMLAYEYNKRERLLTLYAAEIDKNTGQLNGDWKQLTDFQKDDKRDDINYRVALNADSTKMVIASSIEGKEKNSYKVQEFDAAFKASKPVNISNEFDPETFQLEDLLYSGNKKIILVGRIYQYEPGKKKKSKFLDFENYNIRMYDDKGKQVAEINTDINGKWLTSTKLVQKKNNDLVLAAFYSNHKKGKTVDGMLIQRIDAGTGNVISTSQKEINASMLTTLSDAVESDGSTEGETKAERKERENLDKIKDDGEGFSRFMQFSDIYYTSDHGLVILAEKYHHYIYTSQSYTAGSNGSAGHWSSTTYSVYECGDLMMCKVDDAGNIKWLQVLPKAQREAIAVGRNSYGMTTNNYFYPYNMPFYAGFGSLENGNSLYIFFNDNPKNANVVEPGQKVKTASRFGKSNCYILSVDETTGKFKREEFFSNSTEPTAMPRLGSVTGDGMYIVGKDDRLMGKSKIAVAHISVD
jgi:hypothetical protein